MKPLATERFEARISQNRTLILHPSERDLKSHPMRSKLLSLHLVLTILNTHMAVFVSPNAVILSASSNESTLFIQAIKQYLCLSLSRNAVSSVSQVFEASVEIFWRVLSGMRTRLKVSTNHSLLDEASFLLFRVQKEIEVLFKEIFIPILEMRTSTLKQKIVLLNMLQRLCQDPQALVEIYLNYDCDREAIENIYERWAHSHILYQSTATNYHLSQVNGHLLEDQQRSPSSIQK
jgi:brefeldin A-inhibited guanine nucleotide-exchange protein